MVELPTALHVDTTSIILGSLVVILFAVGISLRPPPPQAHPFLLGRQSTIARTRLPSESPVYSNSNTGGVRAPLRPEKRVRTAKDILELSQTCLEGGERGTWIKGGEKLVEVVQALRAGLLSTLGNTPGLVAVLVEDPTDALLVTLALALSPQKPLVISPGSNLPETAQVTAIIQSSTLFAAAQSISHTPDAKWISLGGAGEKSEAAEDLLVTGRALIANNEAPPPTEAEPSDVALTIVSEGVPLSITHLNLTASLISWASLFPASPKSTRPTLSDSLLSFHHPSTPYGFGLALFAIFTSASLLLVSLPDSATHDDLQALLSTRSAQPPSLIFAPSSTFSEPLYKLLLSKMLGDSAIIIRQARNGKLRLLREGVLATKTIWDQILFQGVKKESRVHRVRALFLEGPVEQSRLETFRTTLGVPTVSTLAHAFLLSPLAAGMMWDVQRLPHPQGASAKSLGPVGPPVTGIDIKLRGDEAEILKGTIKGELLVRTPLLPPPSTLPPSLLLNDSPLPQLPAYPGASSTIEDNSGKWLRTGITAEMGKEGVLWL
ncbi:Proteophosphoglycan 5 [Leucosporidium creatinivorum]|uniref:Proteophosphoglycan 5 n=1 Tax=Leucosporidium creatinivorum TaxID=106004 RepID=A0A1Y2EMN1_9BASI|nr:Proteophosphoglycan 5 [Leucosporidium creatinivorum]